MHSDVLAAVLKASADGVVVTDAEGLIVAASDSFCSIVESGRADVLGRILENVVTGSSPEHGSNWSEFAQRVQSSSGRGTCEFELPTPTGVKRLSVLAWAQADTVAEGTGMVTIWRDETELERESRQFRLIADNANYGMGVASLDGTLLYVNKQLAGVHGYSVDEVVGKNLSVFHDEEQMDLVRELNGRLLLLGEYGPTEVWHIHRDGTPFPMLMSGMAISDETGGPRIIAATAIDITDRVRADRELVARERQQAIVAALGRQALASGDLDQLLRRTVSSVTTTLDIMSCGIIELDADGSEFVLREGVGWEDGEVGRAVADAGQGWQGALAMRQAKTVVVEDVREESEYDQPDLFQRHGVISSASVPIRGWGRPFGVLTACSSRSRVFDSDDVNFLEGVANILAHALERRQAEEALATSQERLRNLAARLHAVREEERTVMAREIHDQLGQALTGLKMDLSWLMGRLPPQGPVKERADSMQELLDSTVEAVRSISTQLRPPILDDLGLEAAVEWQANEFSRQTGLECRLDLQIGDTAVQDAHATAAFRILQESLVNVTRHAHATIVNVEVLLRGKKLFLSVSDDGCGIADETLSSARSIGLIGMRERAGALGGEVKIGRRPEGGTSVRLELPLERTFVGVAS